MTGQWTEQEIAGVFLLDPFQQRDARGSFVKTYHAPQVNKAGLDFRIREEFYSISNKNVIRGMHFQKPPHELQKIVYCISGSIVDVLVDLRKSQPTYGKTFQFDLNETNRRVLWIPVGVAHGFLSLEDNTCVVYKTDHEYAPESDAGVRWNTIDFDWNVRDVILSERDQAFPSLDEFVSPF